MQIRIRYFYPNREYFEIIGLILIGIFALEFLVEENSLGNRLAHIRVKNDNTLFRPVS